MPVKNKKIWVSLFLFITLIWFVITFFSAVFFTRLGVPEFLEPHLSYYFHPRWTTVTLGPVLLVQYFWIKSLSPDDRDASSHRYLFMFFLIAGLLTGVATEMGFLPVFYHQMIVWPFCLMFLWDLYKSLKALIVS